MTRDAKQIENEGKQLDPLCLRLRPETKAALVREAGRLQMETGVIVPLRDLIIRLLEEFLGMPVTPFTDPDELVNVQRGRVTIILRMPLGMRDVLDSKRREIELQGRESTYTDIVEMLAGEVEKQHAVDKTIS